ASHTATFAFLAEHQDIDVLRLTYEDLIGSRAERTRAIDDLANWLGTDRSHFMEPAVRGMAPMNAITPPKRAKWYRNHEVLRPVLHREDVRALAAQMGYSDDLTTWP